MPEGSNPTKPVTCFSKVVISLIDVRWLGLISMAVMLDVLIPTCGSRAVSIGSMGDDVKLGCGSLCDRGPPLSL